MPNRSAARKMASLREENVRLRTVLIDMYDEEPCSFDHHGYCQQHLWFTSPAEDVTDKSDRGVCPHKRAQEIFSRSSEP